MSTYLVAFAVGNFGYLEAETKHHVKIRVYTIAGKESQAEFGLQVAVDCLDFFTEYFRIDYPLPKLDLFACPDFAAGAMENWGLTIYREIYLLCNPNDSGVTTLQNIAYVIAHELAHQWFGNLVTVAWWKELWLNEGFATWAGNLAVGDIRFSFIL
jgi:aminopeptidase N